MAVGARRNETHDNDDQHTLAAVGGLVFANLTAPVLAEMRRDGGVWGSLADIARGLASGRKNGEWGPTTPAGLVKLTINPKMTIRASIMLRNGPSSVGPDHITGRHVDMANTSLPETIMMASVGKRIDQVVDAERLRGVVGRERIIRVDPKAWGIRFVLDLPFEQPDIEDLLVMRAAYKMPN